MKHATLVLTAATLLAIGQSTARGGLMAVDLGTAAPPGTLGPYTMTPFAGDGRPLFTSVTTVTSPLGGNETFSIPLDHRQIGTGWATWSNGYTGDVYYTLGANSVTLTLAPNTGAFYFYAEPNPFGKYDITAQADNNTILTLNVDGNSGARGFGFYADPGQSLTSISISSSVDFAIGEFGAAPKQTPEPTTLALAGLAGLTLGGYSIVRRRRRRSEVVPV
jgi:hypothetical protein